MEIYKSTVTPEGRHFIQLGDRIYRRWSDGDITSWHNPKFFKKLVADGTIELMVNPPIEFINDFVEFRNKLILGVIHEDI